jgi:hypothetical protein
MLETVREYAAEQLAKSGADADATVRRCHAAYFLALVDNARRAWAGSARVARRLEREHDNLRAAHRWAEAAGDPELTRKIGEALAWAARTLVEAFHGRSAVHDFERLLASARESGDRKQEVDALLGLMQAYYVLAMDDTDPRTIGSSRRYGEEACARARQIGDARGLIRGLVHSIWWEDFWPEFRDQAAANVREAYALSVDLGDEEAILESRLALWEYLTGEEAGAEGDRLVQVLRERRDLARLNSHLFRLMWRHLEWGNFARCIEVCDVGFRTAAEIGVPPVQYATVRGLALLALGRYGEAWEAIEAEVSGKDHPFGRAHRDLGRGVFYLELDDDQRAVEALRDAIAESRAVHRAWMIRWGHALLARALIRLGRLDDAERSIAAVGLDATDRGAVVVGELRLARGERDVALTWVDGYLALAKERHQRPDVLVGTDLKLRVLLALDRCAEAAALADDALGLADQLGHAAMAWRIRWARAQALGRLGDAAGSARDATEAASIIRGLAATVHDLDLRRRYLAHPAVASVLGAASAEVVGLTGPWEGTDAGRRTGFTL